MIRIQGREVTEIYLGGAPVAALYAGGQLVWRRVSYRGDSVYAVVALPSDAAALCADGITWSAEGSVVPGVVRAAPHLRRIAPGVAENQAFGSVLAAPGEGNASQYSVAGEILPLAFSAAASLPGLPDRLDAACYNALGSYRAGACVSAGEEGGAAHAGSVLSRVYALEGAGEGLLSVQEAAGSCAAWLREAVGRFGQTENSACVTAYADSGKAQGALEGGDGRVAAACRVQYFWVPCELYRGGKERSLSASADAKGSCGAAHGAGVDEHSAPCAAVRTVSGAGSARQSLGAAGGGCFAAMTTEVYTEPVLMDFDTTLIADMDGLLVSAIDAMTIQN